MRLIVAAPPFRQMSHETILTHKLRSGAVVTTPNRTVQRVDAEMCHKIALSSDQQVAVVAPERGCRFQMMMDDVTHKVTFVIELGIHLTTVALPLPQLVLLRVSDIQVAEQRTFPRELRRAVVASPKVHIERRMGIHVCSEVRFSSCGQKTAHITLQICRADHDLVHVYQMPQNM